MPSDITVAGDPLQYPQLAQLALSTAPVSPSVAQLARIAREVADDLALWQDVVYFDSARRGRIRLYTADDHEVWLVSWLPGHRTGLHDHGDTTAVFTVATGRLRERAMLSGPTGEIMETVREIGPGDVRVFGARHVRELVNADTAPAVSVHVYAPALTEVNEYRHATRPPAQPPIAG